MSAAVAAEPPVIPNATGPDPAVMEAIERGNAVVFFDVALGEGEGAHVLGRIKMELFVKDVRTCAALAVLAEGDFIHYHLDIYTQRRHRTHIFSSFHHDVV